MVAQIDAQFSKLGGSQKLVRWVSYLFYEGRPLTTKGRWINPLVFLLYRIQSLMPVAPPKKGPVFILGTGRSGTTILGVSLGIHSDVAFLNEPKAAWAFSHDGEDLIGSYNTNPASYYLSAEDCSEGTRKRLTRIYGCYSKLTNRSLIVDKYPELIFRVDFVRAIFPNAKFLFLYRNGNNTTASIEHWSERKGMNDADETHDWWGIDNRKWHLLCDQVVARDALLSSSIETIRKYTDHKSMAAVEWIATMRQGLVLLEKYPDCVQAVRYEDYVSDPVSREKVLSFCGLSSDSKYTDYCTSALSVTPDKPEPELPKEIVEAYRLTMKQLGYL